MNDCHWTTNLDRKTNMDQSRRNILIGMTRILLLLTLILHVCGWSFTSRQSRLPWSHYGSNINHGKFGRFIIFGNSDSRIMTKKLSPRGLSRSKLSSSLTMRDASASYWFQVGDTVKVVEDVMKAGATLQNRQGQVVETWEKCDVDPTCCCAEQVDIGMAVRVKFQATETDIQDAKFVSDGDTIFYHYFAEEELLKVAKEEEEDKLQISSQDKNADIMTSNTDSDSKEQVAFDGMSCTAFKLEQLNMGKQAQRLAEFEASRAQDDINE